jgi:hypothetical protein
MKADARVGLVACSRSKLRVPARARDLYISSLFRAARAYAEWHYGNGYWYILSAKYCLVDPAAVVEPYDLSLRQLNDEERAVWGRRVARQLSQRVPGTAVLWIHAGAIYCNAVRNAVQHDVVTPVARLRIGEQLAWYRRQRHGENMARDGATQSGPT